MQKVLEQFNLKTVSLSHHPTESQFQGPCNKRRYDYWIWAMEVMTTYGPDINVSIPASLLKDFDKALSLYEDQQYASAKILFENIKQVSKNEGTQSDCAYYIANCAIRTDQDNAEELINNFVVDYPASRKQNQAFIEVAHYYFNQGKYPQALEWFDKVEENNLS